MKLFGAFLACTENYVITDDFEWKKRLLGICRGVSRNFGVRGYKNCPNLRDVIYRRPLISYQKSVLDSNPVPANLEGDARLVDVALPARYNW